MKATYVKTQLQSLINISKIVTIHYNEFDESFVFAGERHDFWEMVYVDKGQVEICRDDEIITLGQGEIIFHRPNEFHSIRSLRSAPNFFVISFVSNSPAMMYFEKYRTTLDKTLKSFLASIIIETEKTFYIPKNDPLLKKLRKKENAAIGGEQLIKTYLEQLLILLVRNINKKNESTVFPSKESMENHLIVAVKEFIDKRVGEVFKVSELCAEIGYSKSYLSRLFHEQTGETIAAYATRMKIKRARQLIREGRLNFAQISDELAFDNPQYFSRVFKRIVKMTPTEFRSSLNFRER